MPERFGGDDSRRGAISSARIFTFADAAGPRSVSKLQGRKRPDGAVPLRVERGVVATLCADVAARASRDRVQRHGGLDRTSSGQLTHHTHAQVSFCRVQAPRPRLWSSLHGPGSGAGSRAGSTAQAPELKE